MREEKFCCPNLDCGFTSYNSGECPECGKELDKIKGDDYASFNSETEEDSPAEVMMSDFDDDPDVTSWYKDEEGQYSAM